jgi:hypothetical protein
LDGAGDFYFYCAVDEDVEEGAAVTELYDGFVGWALEEFDVLVDLCHGFVVELLGLILQKCVVLEVISQVF